MSRVSKGHFVVCAPLCVAAFVWSAQAQEGAVQHVHDPHIVKTGGVYYVFSTGNGIPIRRSRDLKHWENAGRVFGEDLPDWAAKAVPGAKFPWAPDILHVGGEYRLYYSISTFGSNRSYVGLAVNKTLDPQSPDYRWVDRGKVIESRSHDNWNAIDANPVLDIRGEPWLCLGSFWSGVKLRRLDAATGKVSAADATLYSLAARPGSDAIEAPFIFRKGQHYYLFVSFDHCCRGVNSDYKVVVGRAKQITGPYHDRSGKPMLQGGGTVVLAGYGRYRGPGHNSVLRDGDQDWLVHHYYDAEANGTATLQVRPLLWSDDGWPLAGEPLTDAGPTSERAPPGSVAGTWNHSVNFGAGKEIHLTPAGKIGGPDSSATWSLHGNRLCLRWPRRDAPGGVWTDQCILSSDGTWYVGRNQQDMIIRGTKVK